MWNSAEAPEDRSPLSNAAGKLRCRNNNDLAALRRNVSGRKGKRAWRCQANHLCRGAKADDAAAARRCYPKRPFAVTNHRPPGAPINCSQICFQCGEMGVQLIIIDEPTSRREPCCRGHNSTSMVTVRSPWREGANGSARSRVCCGEANARFETENLLFRRKPCRLLNTTS
jgi:hypothetical protein